MKTIQIMTVAILCAFGALAQAKVSANFANPTGEEEIEKIFSGDILFNRGLTHFEIVLSEAQLATDLGFSQTLSNTCRRQLFISNVEVLEAKEEPTDDGDGDGDEEQVNEENWIKLADLIPYKGWNLHQNKEALKYSKVRFSAQHNGRLRQLCSFNIVTPKFEVPTLEKHTGEIIKPTTCDEEAECLLSFAAEEDEETFKISEESANLLNLDAGRFLLHGYRDANSDTPELFVGVRAWTLAPKADDKPADDDQDEPSDDDQDEPSDDDQDDGDEG
jgi:hypothetical protein